MFRDQPEDTSASSPPLRELTVELFSHIVFVNIQADKKAWKLVEQFLGLMDLQKLHCKVAVCNQMFSSLFDMVLRKEGKQSGVLLSSIAHLALVFEEYSCYSQGEFDQGEKEKEESVCFLLFTRFSWSSDITPVSFFFLFNCPVQKADVPQSIPGF